MTTEATKRVKKKYKVIAPDGEVFTRTTERTYTYAVLYYQEGKNWAGLENFWGLVGFCGTKELAEKLERTTRNRWDVKNELFWTTLIVPVEEQ